MDTVSTTAVNISIKVTLNAIGDSSICRGEQSAVREEWFSVIDRHVKGITGSSQNR